MIPSASRLNQLLYVTEDDQFARAGRDSRGNTTPHVFVSLTLAIMCVTRPGNGCLLVVINSFLSTHCLTPATMRPNTYVDNVSDI